VIIPPGDQKLLADVKKHLNDGTVVICEEFGKFETVQFQKMGKNADELMSQLKKKLLSLNEIPKNGLVYFNGFYTDEDGVEHHYAHTLEAFRPLKTGIFLANYRFHTEPLHKLLDEAAGEAIGIILFDYTGLLLARVKGSHLQTLQRVAMQIPRFRATLQSTDSLYIRVMEFVRQTFQDEKTKQVNVSGLILAGNDKLHQRLNETLPKELKDKVLKVVNVKSEEEEGVHEALEQLIDQLPHIRIFQEIALLQRFFQIRKDSPSKVAVGPQAVAAAVDGKQAKTLIMFEDLKVHRVTDRSRVVYWEEGINKPAELEKLGEPHSDELLTHYYLTLANKLDLEGLSIELVGRHSRLGIAFWKDCAIAAVLK